MNKHKTQNNYDWLVGLIIISPIVFSTKLLEMDNLQKLVLFILVIPAFLYLNKIKVNQEAISVNRTLFISLLLFPFTFFTSFLNGSSGMLLLQLTYLLPSVFIIIFTLYTLNKIGEENFFKIISFSVVIVSTLFSFIGLLQVMGIELIPLPMIIIPGSTIGHRGFAAEYLLPAIPFLLILKNYIKKNYTPLLLFAGVVNLSFLFFTRSRSALGLSILILIVLSVYIILKKDHKDKIKTLVPIIGVYIIAFLLSLIPPVKGERADFGANVTSVVDTENRSNKMRMNFWDASIKMIKENPITGVGLQKWSGIYPKYYGNEFVDSHIYFVHAIHSHNDFLELFAENGFAAPLVYLIIILLIIYNLYKKSKSNKNYLFILLSAIATIGFSLIAFPMSKLSSYFLFSIAGGLALSSIKEKAKVIKFSATQISYALILFLVIGIFTSYIRLSSELNYIKAIEYKNGGDYENMVKELAKVSNVLYPYDVTKQPVEYYSSMGYYRLRKYDEALFHALNSEKLSPNNPLVLHNTAAIYQSSKRYDEAISYYRRMQKQFPNYIDPQINLLIIYSETLPFEKGKALFDDLIKKDSLNPRFTQFKSKYSNQF
ncbi:MAG: O-antigen ligase family protein [Ignavibacteriaceae bacterium]